MKSIRVLIVDDSAVIRKIVGRCLRHAGINMPAIDGLEFLRGYRTLENAKNTPVVMIPTEGSESRVVEALSAGARGYIRKPFTPDQVKERVAPLLEGLR